MSETPIQRVKTCNIRQDLTSMYEENSGWTAMADLQAGELLRVTHSRTASHGR